MGRISGKDTAPELLVRRLVYSMGYRFRLHAASLPGRPDLVFRRSKKAIFIHGCFWHRHRCRRGSSMPTSNVRFWRRKLDGNKARDVRTQRALRRLGWSVLIIWECQLRDVDTLRRRVRVFLNGGV
jgi:DNA mismatch endonuclease, patch repair protein